MGSARPQMGKYRSWTEDSSMADMVVGSSSRIASGQGEAAESEEEHGRVRAGGTLRSEERV